MGSNPPDLSGLNAAEREALDLLASGHTAKSIANLIGRSEGAVNERLREARRKTGVGSSRELARILRDQKNRHEEMGVTSRVAVEEELPLPAGGYDRRFPKAFVMIAILTATGAISLGIVAAFSPPQSAAPIDPVIGSIEGSPSTTLPALRERLRNEARDPAWAPRSEAAPAAAYRKIGGLAGDVRIQCGSTLCKVTGTSSTGSISTLTQTMSALQGGNLMTELASAGLHSVSQGFGGPDKSRFAFVAYWSSATSS